MNTVSEELQVPRYRTIAAPVEADIEVKRSVFRAVCVPVSDEAAARAVIEKARKDYWDARHHCSAFVLGPTSDIRRSNDDGEPSGTAGMPILDCLLGRELTDVVAVVIRWFGGTLLGTGGLVRAYTDSTVAALELAKIKTYEQRLEVQITVSLEHVGKLDNALRADGVVINDVAYGPRKAIIYAAVAPHRLEQVTELVAVTSSGSGEVEQTGQRWVPV